MIVVEILGWAGLAGIVVWFVGGVIQAVKEEARESAQRAQAEADMLRGIEEAMRKVPPKPKCCGRCHKN